MELGVIDAIVPEPEGGAHTDYDAAAGLLGAALQEQLAELDELPGDELRRKRRARYRSLGVFA
jgi:acetyl-CoA carboxylase alpha subunit